MKIGSRFDYALSCILRVADGYDKKMPVRVSYIAGKEKIDSDYVEQLLVMMKKADLLKSIRGPAGGYLLNRPPARITIKDIAEAINMKALEIICFRTKGRRKKCVHIKDCKLKDIWLKLRKTIENFFDNYNLKYLLALRKKEKCW